MRPAEKVKATIAASGITHEEFCELCGISRTLLYSYFKPQTHMDDFTKGVKCIAVSKKLWALCEAGRLPFKGEVQDRIRVLREMLKSDTVELQP